MAKIGNQSRQGGSQQAESKMPRKPRYKGLKRVPEMAITGPRISITYGGGCVKIDYPDYINVLEIRTNGKAHIKDETPPGCMAIGNPNHFILLCYAPGTNFNEKILSYTGSMFIAKATAFNAKMEEVDCIINHQEIDTFNSLSVKFNTADEFEKYWRDRQNGVALGPSKLIKENQNTEDYNLKYYFDDGVEYNGKFHIHHTGQAMTGSIHNKESKYIYNKTAKGNLFKIHGIHGMKNAVKRLINIKRVT